MNRPPPTTPPPPTSHPAAWYADPWDPTAWRWYDGSQWTGHTAARTPPPPTTAPTAATAASRTLVAPDEKKPRLPSFLSPPVLITAIPTVILLFIAAVIEPVSIALALIPPLIVGPTLLWMDRVEPEPWSSRLHAFLWGACVAGLVAIIINSIVAALGGEILAAVVSAPIVEESMKVLAIIWAVRRREVDGIMDGLVYAGFAGLGFATVENVSYFAIAESEGVLTETFVGRALLTPFAHPLFTAWAGLAIGWAIANRKSLHHAWWGLALAILSHAFWNGSLSFAESETGMIVMVVALLAFVGLFVATIVAVILLRRRDQARLNALGPSIAARYQLDATRVASLLTPAGRKAVRAQASDRAGRRAVTREAATIARLAALNDISSPPDPIAEARLVSVLRDAVPEPGTTAAS